MRESTKWSYDADARYVCKHVHDKTANDAATDSFSQKKMRKKERGAFL